MSANLISTAASLTLVLLFSVAALTKLRSRDDFERVLVDLGVVRRRSRRLIARAVPSLELGVALLLIVDTRAGGLAAVVLLMIFSLTAAVALRRHTGVRCGCFSPTSSPPLGLWTLVRNAGLLLAAVMVLLNPGGAPRFDPGLLLAAVGFAAAVLLLEEGLALRQVLRLESGRAEATQ